MFPPLTATSRPQKRSFQALVRGAVSSARDALDTALEFATLGEATTQGFVGAPASQAPAASPRQGAAAPAPAARRAGRPAPGGLPGPPPAGREDLWEVSHRRPGERPTCEAHKAL